MQENPPIPNSGSLPFEDTGRVLAVLAEQVAELQKEIYEVKKEKLLKETQLPPEILEQLGLPLTPPPRLKRGRGCRPLLSHEILAAKKSLHEKHPEVNEAMVARKMGVSYPTYKKHAKRLGLWDPKPNVRNKKSVFDPERGKYPLSQVLEGKHPDYPVFRIKFKLLQSGVKKEQCESCGWHEKHMGTGLVPLFMNFMDGNHQNHVLDNIKLLCPNCTAVSGRGYIRSGRKVFDVDYLQGAGKDYEEPPLC